MDWLQIVFFAVIALAAATAATAVWDLIREK
jgi:hypothetical protein